MRPEEMDYRAVFGTQAKWVTEIDQVEAHSRAGLARLRHLGAAPVRW